MSFDPFADNSLAGTLAPAPNTVGSWDQQKLARFVQGMISNDPTLPNSYTGQEVVALEKLVARGKLDLSTEAQDTIRALVANVTPTAMSLTNSWVNYGTGYDTAAYVKDICGVVHLSGLIKSGTLGSAAFTLPTGYRVLAVRVFPVISNDALGRVEVRADGTVVPVSPSNNTWVSLDGISFLATA